jgi:hypothetical protein
MSLLACTVLESRFIFPKFTLNLLRKFRATQKWLLAIVLNSFARESMVLHTIILMLLELLSNVEYGNQISASDKQPQVYIKYSQDKH